jgi:hypothetical protein
LADILPVKVAKWFEITDEKAQAFATLILDIK